MNSRKDPQWWDASHESAWDRVKAAFKRDWDQTKHDFGGNQPDTDQDVNDTVKQAMGKQPIPPRGAPAYEDEEMAYRFGYGARRRYGSRYPTWDDRLEAELRRDWDTTYADEPTTWAEYRSAVRRGWEYEENPGGPIR